MTDALGMFSLQLTSSPLKAAPASSVVRHQGYAPACVALEDSRLGSHVNVPAVPLLKLSARAILDSQSGGHLIDADSGTTFYIPTDAFARCDGSKSQGKVSLSAALLNPANSLSLAAMPGDISGTDILGNPVRMRSFGAMFLESKDSATGECLDVSSSCEFTWSGIFL